MTETKQNRANALRFDTEQVIFAYPATRGGQRIDAAELQAVLAIFEVPSVMNLTEEQESAFRRYLSVRAAGLRHPL